MAASVLPFYQSNSSAQHKTILTASGERPIITVENCVSWHSLRVCPLIAVLPSPRAGEYGTFRSAVWIGVRPPLR